MQISIPHELATERHGGWSRGKLLLVDDDMRDLLHYSVVLDRLGYDVKAFSTYGEAAACMEREIFDMVVVKPRDIHV
jgi:DNA-binding NtrC family response regulator